jgi:hypothetical protein
MASLSFLTVPPSVTMLSFDCLFYQSFGSIPIDQGGNHPG